MDKIIKNYEEPLEKPMSTKQYFKFLKHKKSVKKMNKRLLKNKNKHGVDSCGHDHSNDPKPHDHSNDPKPNIPPADIKLMSFAILIDDTVADVIHVQDSLGYFLQKNPKFILLDDQKHMPHQGWIYKDEEFVDFKQVLNKISPTRRG